MVTVAENISAAFKEHFFFTLIKLFAKHNRKKSERFDRAGEKRPEFECQSCGSVLAPDWPREL